MKRKLTRAGIAYDLNVSPYRKVINYDNEFEFTFVFSGQYNLDSFNKKFEENREKINESLSNRFNIYIYCDILCDVKLYSSIEKRGFLIEGKEERFECLNNIKLDGMKLTTRN